MDGSASPITSPTFCQAWVASWQISPAISVREWCFSQASRMVTMMQTLPLLSKVVHRPARSLGSLRSV